MDDMEDNLVASIKSQILILYKNIDELFSSLDVDMLDEKAGRWPLWRQLYHMLHSMDQWFINPYRYNDHMKNGADIAGLVKETGIRLSKKDLTDYYASIRNKIDKYIAGLDTATLEEKPEACPFTRFELFIGQTRHIMYHIGMIHGILIVRRDVLPEYYGLSASVKPAGK
jgi:hypothetical protein